MTGGQAKSAKIVWDEPDVERLADALARLLASWWLGRAKGRELSRRSERLSAEVNEAA